MNKKEREIHEKENCVCCYGLVACVGVGPGGGRNATLGFRVERQFHLNIERTRYGVRFMVNQ